MSQPPQRDQSDISQSVASFLGGNPLPDGLPQHVQTLAENKTTNTHPAERQSNRQLKITNDWLTWGDANEFIRIDGCRIGVARSGVLYVAKEGGLHLLMCAGSKVRFADVTYNGILLRRDGRQIELGERQEDVEIYPDSDEELDSENTNRNGITTEANLVRRGQEGDDEAPPDDETLEDFLRDERDTEDALRDIEIGEWPTTSTRDTSGLGRERKVQTPSDEIDGVEGDEAPFVIQRDRLLYRGGGPVHFEGLPVRLDGNDFLYIVMDGNQRYLIDGRGTRVSVWIAGIDATTRALTVAGDTIRLNLLESTTADLDMDDGYQDEEKRPATPDTPPPSESVSDQSLPGWDKEAGRWSSSALSGHPKVDDYPHPKQYDIPKYEEATFCTICREPVFAPAQQEEQESAVYRCPFFEVDSHRVRIKDEPQSKLGLYYHQDCVPRPECPACGAVFASVTAPGKRPARPQRKVCLADRWKGGIPQGLNTSLCYAAATATAANAHEAEWTVDDVAHAYVRTPSGRRSSSAQAYLAAYDEAAKTLSPGASVTSVHKVMELDQYGRGWKASLSGLLQWGHPTFPTTEVPHTTLLGKSLNFDQYQRMIDTNHLVMVGDDNHWVVVFGYEVASDTIPQAQLWYYDPLTDKETNKPVNDFIAARAETADTIIV
ncbi:hypothetical protein [Streptomyces sp. NPDC047028]|uniref:hypothetical protein n=1 Tax=Streptomyces sp. NPDC047028 TaxID=3155793 RepID=UPI00340E8B06